MTARIVYGADGRPTPALPAIRSVALRDGIHAYFTGHPCKQGHTAHRYTVTGACSACKGSAKGTYDAQTLSRARSLKKWNGSTRAQEMKQRWKEADPKWAWAVSAAGGMRSRAAQSGAPVDVDKEYVYAILTDACPVLGTPFIFLGAGKVHAASPTIDRIVPEKGYTRGNIVIISQKANAIKSNATWQEIRQVSHWLKNLQPPAPSQEEVSQRAALRARYADTPSGRRSRADGIAALAIHNTGRKRAPLSI